MRLYLAQHGLAKPSDEDRTRPLSDQGREDVTRVAGFLSLFEKPRPARVVHSGKLRAQQTAMMFAQAWGGLPVEQSAQLAANEDPGCWLQRLAREQEDLMLVGHLPHLQRLAALLVCDDANREVIHFRNGGVVCLQRHAEGWMLLWQINPTLFYGE